MCVYEIKCQCAEISKPDAGPTKFAKYSSRKKEKAEGNNKNNNKQRVLRQTSPEQVSKSKVKVAAAVTQTTPPIAFRQPNTFDAIADNVLNI